VEGSAQAYRESKRRRVKNVRGRFPVSDFEVEAWRFDCFRPFFNSSSFFDTAGTRKYSASHSFILYRKSEKIVNTISPEIESDLRKK
jgi:hypothetical protein